HGPREAAAAAHRRQSSPLHVESLLLQGRHGGAPRTEVLMARTEFEPIIGRYLRLELLGREHRLYIEEAGQGIPLLCLHTAGSDTRQYRALMNEPEILKNFRVIAFDLPWHGKSS